MALLLKALFGGGNAPAQPSGAPVDPDFADFATAASPAAPSHAASSPFTAGSTNTPSSLFNSFFAPPIQTNGRPFTKWYRIWERVTIHDFYQELFILPTLLLLMIVNVFGARWNKSIARGWAKTHVPLLENEYAQVGFKMGGTVKAGKEEEALDQKKMNEFYTYATGRQNVAWTDIKLTLYKRFNPLLWLMESFLSFFFESISAPAEKLEATTYCFDGKEKAMLPPGSSAGANSTFDGFVWAVVHKDRMQKLRDDRYDLSLTTTRDHAKLPDWATVMSESSEITDALLTPDLLRAIESEGEALEALIITDMPIDAPKKLNELQPRKRVTLVTKLPPASSSSSTPTAPNALFTYFLRLPDTLVSSAHFRPEALRKIRATREEEMRKIRKLDEDEKAEERKTAADKHKKEERERKLKGMSAEEQRKFLERERGDERKKGQKRMSVKA